MWGGGGGGGVGERGGRDEITYHFDWEKEQYRVIGRPEVEIPNYDYLIGFSPCP